METQAPSTTTKTTTKQDIIQQTEDFSIFKQLPHNRPVVQSHVIRLAASMADRPHLRPARPVLVNDKFQVIDGQHRLKASELNGQSVYFMVVSGLTIDDARLLNALQRTWSLLDYAYSYASSKVPAYVQFVKTYEARELPPSVVMEYMSNRQGSRRQHDFRVGALEPVEQRELDMRLDQLEDIVQGSSKAVTPYVVSMAFLSVLKNEGYDHARMLRKLTDRTIEPQSDRIGYVRELERIYNADVPFNGPSYLRFF